MAVKLIQTNLNRHRRAMDLLRHTCSSEGTDIAVVSEPNVNMAKYSKAWIVDKMGYAAIFIPSTNCKVTRKGVGKGFVWVEANGTIINSCYISPNIDTACFETYLCDLGLDIKKQQKNSILVGGDFNAKSHIWGSNKEDTRGRILSEWLNEMDFYVVNEGNAPTFSINGKTSHIDVTMCSHDMIGKIKEWRVSDEENLSDHQNIYMEITDQATEILTKKNTKKIWYYKKEKLEKFTKTIQQMINAHNKEFTVTGLMNLIAKA